MASSPDSHSPSEPLLETPLAAAHGALGARMVPFAGYLMPVQYPEGILAEHNWTRTHAGLFDVSHMGQALLVGPDHETTARALEALAPADFVSLAPGKQRYSQLTADDGGIRDDFMATRPADPAADGTLILVVNAACKGADFAHIEANLPSTVKLVQRPERALLALQGPEAAMVMARHCPEAADLDFMTALPLAFDGVPVEVSRSGYTGEDGYEISVAAEDAPALWAALLAEPEVKAIGLGARDSLRLEAGLCLYGHDINLSTSPIEAALNWSIQKRRRLEGGFPGADRVQRELAEGPARVRVGLKLEGRAPAREGAEIASNGEIVGRVTSGGFAPTLQAPIAMGYVPPALSAPGTRLDILVRGKALPAVVTALPFVPTRYARKQKTGG
ncbi:glycine cleavage system aminomethyltransferase GcvT [Xanthobacter aminoxidans]|uniref:glycine cleavage system aminomethyltransferase GcvT n=1 Tax=Xanthobacter aminoxidans TaxID=186280 RepID=UPI002022BC50|nr:glycine cleavage system aminomethyltransferase GcvT [Xanthobacter aminoxidans]MCL8380808.1 glycine cleavage system aminomethyltransferase GcvT [Xanthobacter aminoxidans]